VAALVVVWFHMALKHWGPVPAFGHLAVDMFFLLSGFVLALANDPRFARGATVTDFLRKRVIRLYPTYLVGWALGALAVFIPIQQGLSRSYPVGALLANAFLLPYPAAHGKIAPLFVLDGPAWSLCLEFYVANLLYAVGWKALKGPALIVLVAASVAGLAVAQHHYVNLSGGAGFDTWPEGLARVMASFFGGVLLARIYNRYEPGFRAPTWSVLAALAVLLFAPISGALSQPYELFCVVVAFPALIFLGAASRSRRPWLGARLGDASYALYVIHIPALYFTGLALAHTHVRPNPAIALAALASLVGLAYALHRLVDEPVRRGLTTRSLKRERLRMSGSNPPEPTIATTPFGLANHSLAEPNEVQGDTYEAELGGVRGHCVSPKPLRSSWKKVQLKSF
jgi:peptidoglycan/LPS O-acetylase OafA/YrhL